MSLTNEKLKKLLEIGGFGPYMICLYLPLVPWERWTGRRKK